jgi:hypothetical protein
VLADDFDDFHNQLWLIPLCRSYASLPLTSARLRAAGKA